LAVENAYLINPVSGLLGSAPIRRGILPAKWANLLVSSAASPPRGALFFAILGGDPVYCPVTPGVAMPLAQPIHSEPDETGRFLAAVEEGVKAADDAKTVPYEKVRRWLLSWGTKSEQPDPKRG
jgi:hypothetical protein